jgi:polyisoprenoid-binding protein YceI
MGTQIQADAQEIYKTNTARIEFVSDAPLEFITAHSDNCQGVVSLPSGEFVFRVFIKTFDGFNNQIQKEHFYENYMEVSDYPEALFKGFVLEELNFPDNAPKKVRAKGELSIHGVHKEEIIPLFISRRQDGNLSFEAEFSILLDKYNIDIPNIVKQKIAEKIIVKVSGILVKQSP